MALFHRSVNHFCDFSTSSGQLKNNAGPVIAAYHHITHTQSHTALHNSLSKDPMSRSFSYLLAKIAGVFLGSIKPMATNFTRVQEQCPITGIRGKKVTHKLKHFGKCKHKNYTKEKSEKKLNRYTVKFHNFTNNLIQFINHRKSENEIWRVT